MAPKVQRPSMNIKVPVPPHRPTAHHATRTSCPGSKYLYPSDKPPPGPPARPSWRALPFPRSVSVRHPPSRERQFRPHARPTHISPLLTIEGETSVTSRGDCERRDRPASFPRPRWISSLLAAEETSFVYVRARAQSWCTPQCSGSTFLALVCGPPFPQSCFDFLFFLWLQLPGFDPWAGPSWSPRSIRRCFAFASSPGRALGLPRTCPIWASCGRARRSP